MTLCPPVEALAALAGGGLPADDAENLHVHVRACTRCTARIAAGVVSARVPSAAGDRTHDGMPDGLWSPPDAFDDFRVIRPLGHGGMGRVYLGYDDLLDRSVALKFVSADNPDPRALDRFRVEARAIARLQHPNVVSVYRIGDVRGRPYIAYEFVAGEPLDQLPKPSTWQRALHVGLGLARGLAAAHRRGVLHRDIKPANVVLGEDGEVKLLDFGLAKLVDEPSGDGYAPSEPAAIARFAPRSDALMSTLTIPVPSADGSPEADAGGRGQAGLTESHTVLGTPVYLAPELWSGAAATTRSDVYALGLLLYELCVGRLPHAELELRAMARFVCTKDLPPLRALCPDVPDVVAEAIDRCLQRAPEERFASAEELQAAIEEANAFCCAFQLVRPSSPPAGADELDVTYISASFARIAPRVDTVVARFYERLFDLDPRIRALFPTDMRQQRMKLASALQLAIDNLRAPERLVPMLEDLGRRHAAYRVLPEHFDVVGRALLGALAELEGSAWTLAVERAWERAYAQITAAMRRGLDDGRQSSRLAPVDSAVAATRYTTSAEASLAYRIIPGGPLDLVLVQGWVTHVEAAWGHPAPARFFESLASPLASTPSATSPSSSTLTTSSARVVVFDQRGTGMSERDGAGASVAQQADDLRAVLDAAGVERAVLFGIGAGCAPCALFAAERPSRVRALVAYGGAARLAAWPESLFGLSGPTAHRVERELKDGWGHALFLDRLAPSASADASFQRWWASYLRLGASPGGAARLLRSHASADVTAALPSVQARTLVVHRGGDGALPVAAGRDLAHRIPGARYVELPGVDHLPFAGDTSALLAEVRSFLAEVAASEPR